MSHQSENANRLPILREKLLPRDLDRAVETNTGDVFLIVPPYRRAIVDMGRSPAYMGLLRRLARDMDNGGILCLLTTPQDAAESVTLLEGVLRFQLWTAVKVSKPRPNSHGLPEHHASLLVLSKYRGPLRHAKTRIAYSFCPACDRTTKDYGGKKHTYHYYGTLMSDVWRDIEWSPDQEPDEIAERLADVFGIDPHRRLRLLDLRSVPELKPRASGPSALFSEGHASRLRAEPLASRLVLGDCVELLSAIPDSSVDFAFADPPYNLAKTYDNWDDSMEMRQYFQWCDRWLGELARVLKPGRTCAVLNIPLWAVRHFQFMKTRLTFQNWIAWEGMGLPVRMIMPSHYSIVCFAKGPPVTPPGQSRTRHSARELEAITGSREFFCARPDCIRKRLALGVADREPITDLWWDIHRLKHNSRRMDHPCQLPPALMRRLIAYFTNEGEVVLDPFNGVGTTTLCARSLDRRYIGIELSEKYHAIAQDRHAFLERGGDPFAKTNGVPKAKNSRVPRMGGQPYAVSKKALQLEVRAIAKRLGRLPTRDEVARHSKYPMMYFDQYFVSWGEVCAAARTTGMSEVRVG